MKVYQIKKGKYVSLEIEPCEKCTQWRWGNEQKRAIHESIEFIRDLLIARDRSLSEHWGLGFALGEDGKKLDSLYPIREPYEYDSNQSQFLLGVLQVAALLAPTDIDMKAILTAYRKMFWFGQHICGHAEHVAGYFWEPDFPKELGITDLMIIYVNLSEIQNKKTSEEIVKHWKKVWDERYQINHPDVKKAYEDGID